MYKRKYWFWLNVRCNRRDELADLLDVMEVEEVLKDGDYSIQVRAKGMFS